MGCDQAYLLCDEAFEEADVTATARILSAAIENLGGADLVVPAANRATPAPGRSARAWPRPWTMPR